MEGCPKTLMINFDLKESGPIEDGFEKPLRNYIRDFYNENSEAYSKEIQQISQLRKSITNIPREGQGCTTLRRYYAQLHYLQSRFPMGEGGAAAVTFLWYDVYSGDPVVYTDVRYEQACVLFNLGSLYSQLAGNEDRLTDESLKIALTHFQSAAGAFQYLRENFSLNEIADMNEDILGLKITIMLGQALECILEKSMRDNKIASVIARIAIQVRDYFKDGLNYLNKPGTLEMGSTLQKLWIKHLKIKMLSYEAIAYSFMSNDADQREKYGEKVTYLKAGSEKINEASKLLKNQPDKVVDTVQFIMDVVGNQYKSAVKDNEFVYHMSVPELSNLEELKGVNFVKPIPFQFDDPTVAGQDIFQKLVPMKAHEASSLYSEKKDELFRHECAKIEEKNVQLSEYMTAMKIEDLLDPKEDTLPDELLAKNMFLRDNPDIISKVEKTTEDLLIVTSSVESSLKDVKEKLDHEKTYEEQIGPDQYPLELKSFLTKFEQCNSAHVKASQTNNELIKHSTESRGIIQILSGDPRSILQTLPSQNVVDAPSDEPVVQRIREILGKVEKMKTQRKKLIDKLRKELNKDDITSKLVIRDQGNKEAFFNEEIQKHNETISYIEKNLSAQDNIIQALTEANAKYALTRQKASSISEKFDIQVKSYVQVVSMYLEIKDRLRNGSDFYNQLDSNVKTLQKSVEEYCNSKNQKRGVKNVPPSRPTAKKPDILRSKQIHPNFIPGQIPFNLNQINDQQFLPRGFDQFGQIPPRGLPTNIPRMPHQDAPVPRNVLRFATPRMEGDPQRFQLTPQQQGSMLLPSSPDLQNQKLQYPPQQINRLPMTMGYVRPSDQTQRPLRNQPMSPNMSTTGSQRIPSSFIPGMSVPLSNTNTPPKSMGQYRGPEIDRVRNDTSLVPNIPGQIRPGISASSPNLGTPRHATAMTPNRMPLQIPFQPMNNQRFSTPQSAPEMGNQRQPFANQASWQPIQPSFDQHMQIRPNRPAASTFRLPLNQHQQPPNQLNRPRQPHIPPQMNMQPRPGYTLSTNQQIPLQPKHMPPQQLAGLHRPSFQQPLSQQGAHESNLEQQRVQHPNQGNAVLSFGNKPAFGNQNTRIMEPMNDPYVPENRMLPPPLMPERHGDGPLADLHSSQQANVHIPSSTDPRNSMVSQYSPSESHFTVPQQKQNQVPQLFTQQQSLNQTQTFQTQNPNYSNSIQSGRSMSHQADELITPRPPLINNPYSPSSNMKIPWDAHVLNARNPTDAISTSYVAGSSIPQAPADRTNVNNLPPQRMIPTVSSNLIRSPTPNVPHQILPSVAPQMFHQSIINNITRPQTQPSAPPPQTQMYPRQQSTGPQQPETPMPYAGPSVPHPYSNLPSGVLFASKPTMSPSSDPIISNILGKQDNNPSFSQMEFQQLQLMQQQSLIAFLQTQQQFKKSEEDSKFQALQNQIAQYQKVIDDLQKEVKDIKKIDDKAHETEQAQTQDDQQKIMLETILGMLKNEQEKHIANSGDSLLKSIPTGTLSSSGSLENSTVTTPHHPPDYPSITSTAKMNELKSVPIIASELPTPPAQFAKVDYPSITNHGTSIFTSVPEQQSVQTFNDQEQVFNVISNISVKPVERECNEGSNDESNLRLSKGKESREIVPSPVSESTDILKVVAIPVHNRDLNVDHTPFYEPKLDNESPHSITNDVLPTLPRENSDAVAIGKETPEALNQKEKALQLNTSFDDDIILPRETSLNYNDSGQHDLNVQAISNDLISANNRSRLDCLIDPINTSTSIVPERSGDTNASMEAVEKPSINGVESNAKKTTDNQQEMSEQSSLSEAKVTDESKPEKTSEQIKNSPSHFKPVASPPLSNKFVHARRASSKSSPAISSRTSPNLSARSSPIPNSQAVQLDDMDLKERSMSNISERSLSNIIDHKQLARQLGRMSFYVGEPDEAIWKSYIKELEASTAKLHDECKSLCRPMKNQNIDGFGTIWNDLSQVELMDSRSYSSTHGEANVSKNRYRDILPWDHSRVILKSLPNDYINASFIENLTPLSPRYIATQGPIPQCFEDFWTMIWEQKSSVIVMLTNEVEGHKLKCHPYWCREKDAPTEYGNMVVIMTEEQSFTAWKIRKFTLLNKKCDDIRSVKQLQFTSWPDYGTPESPYDLLSFTDEVYASHQNADPSFAYPVVLHCSAGVGRTGSFCCLYSGMREIEGQNNLIEIPGVIRKLRQSRPHMVQRKEQLIFCYQALLCFAQQFVSTELNKLDNSRRISLQKGPFNASEDSLFSSASTQMLQSALARPSSTGKFHKSSSDVSVFSNTDSIDSEGDNVESKAKEINTKSVVKKDTEKNVAEISNKPVSDDGNSVRLPNIMNLPNYPGIGLVSCTPSSSKAPEETEEKESTSQHSNSTGNNIDDINDETISHVSIQPKFKINADIFQTAKATVNEQSATEHDSPDIQES